MARLLILGGCGFIGSNLVASLIRRNHHVVVLDRPGIRSFRVPGLNEQVKIVSGSLKDVDSIVSVIRDQQVEIVVHLVSGLIPSSSREEYKAELDAVINPTIELLPVLAGMKVRFLFFSSGGTTYGDSGSVPIPENAPLRPVSFYGFSKLILEQAVEFEARTSGLDYIIVRPSNPYGPGQALSGKQGFIAVALGLLLADRPITIWGDGSVVRDYIFISDLADAITSLVELWPSQETFNIGSGEGHSLNSVLKHLADEMGISPKTTFTRPRPLEIGSVILDCKKLRARIGGVETSLAQGLHLFHRFEKDTQR